MNTLYLYLSVRNMYKFSYEHPRHLHNIVHVKFALLYLHWLHHPLLHPHFMTARHAAPAGGSVIHFIFNCALATSHVLPKSAGLRNCGALIVAWQNTHDLLRTLLSTHVGLVHLVLAGCFQYPCLSEWIAPVFIRWHFFQNSSDDTWWQLISQLWEEHSCHYMSFAFMTVYRELEWHHHAVQAVRFPFPTNGEVTSHPVKAWNAGRPSHLASPSAWAIYSCGVKIPECSASTKWEPETVTTILLRHTNAYD